MKKFEQSASELSQIVKNIKNKKNCLAKEIEDKKEQINQIDYELETMADRKNQMETLLKNYISEQQNLFSIIEQTQKTKEKIAESLKFLTMGLRKMQMGKQTN